MANWGSEFIYSSSWVLGGAIAFVFSVVAQFLFSYDGTRYVLGGTDRELYKLQCCYAARCVLF